MPALSTSENQFHSPICRSIGTMELQSSICSSFDIPSSLKIASLVQENVSLHKVLSLRNVLVLVF